MFIINQLILNRKLVEGTKEHAELHKDAYAAGFDASHPELLRHSFRFASSYPAVCGSEPSFTTLNSKSGFVDVRDHSNACTVKKC